MTNRIKVLIAEDEDLIRTEMVRLLHVHWPDCELVGAAEDGSHAVELWEEHSPDVAFLDIQMPGMTGLQVAALIAPTTQVVFVTAYDQHALAAFEAGAVDYLLKPVQVDRLEHVIGKLKQRIQVKSEPRQVPADLAQIIATLTSQLQNTRAKEPIIWISASLGQNIKLIAVKDIIYFQSDSKYTRIVTLEGEALVRKSLRELLDDLDASIFKQVHRSTVVNMHTVSEVDRDGTGRGTLKFKGIKDQVDISSAYMGLFRPS